ncbi:MAG: 2-succinyl-5-enolpyruvyl-6-hydroxy-3-cyclohexene-1-carboxylic-acid synthase [Acidimicrobiales bacterium]
MTITDAATFCATLVDEWARAGITDAFVAPGSRSTPLALALAAEDRLQVHVFHDERTASFAALGHGLASEIPAITLCTSGTAAAHFHAAVVEADLSSVPMIVCTADRPPELWDIGAPQTIDQTHLFGRSVRFFAEPGVPDAVASTSWRSLASRAVAEALGWSSRPGPVQLNLSFRDPLVGQPGPLPAGRDGAQPWHKVTRHAPSAGQARALPRTTAGALPSLVTDGKAVSGVIIAGAGTSEPSAVTALAERLGWPVLADHRSGCRSSPASINHFDALLRSSPFADAQRPAIVIRFGEALASKVLSQWLASTSADLIAVVDRRRWSDPERMAGFVVDTATIMDLLRSITGADPADDLDRWREADDAAATAIADVLAIDEASGTAPATTEVATARSVVADVPAGGALVIASSMPVRDFEWYGPPRDDIDVFANRGANGIDGTVATAIGVALTGRPTTVLLGDVAFLHDSAALIGLANRDLDLRIVVVDNDGGGIFSFLPQAELLDAPTYEQLFGTPHGTDLAALSIAYGLTVLTGDTRPGEGRAQRITVEVVPSSRERNRDAHRTINDAAIDAVENLARR